MPGLLESLRTRSECSQKATWENPMTEELQRLLDEHAVRAVTDRYARAVDRLDWELLRSCYHADAHEDHGHRYRGSVEGFITWLAEVLSEFESTTHYITNQIVDIEGDDAWCEAYCLGIHRTMASDGQSPRDTNIVVRYLSQLQRRDGEWRISSRVCAFEPGNVSSITENIAPTDRGTPGTRDRRDPSYTHLRLRFPMRVA
jgi:hypothetical protein